MSTKTRPHTGERIIPPVSMPQHLVPLYRTAMLALLFTTAGTALAAMIAAAAMTGDSNPMLLWVGVLPGLVGVAASGLAVHTVTRWRDWARNENVGTCMAIGTLRLIPTEHSTPHCIEEYNAGLDNAVMLVRERRQ